MRKIKMKLNKRQTKLLIVLVFFSLLVTIYYLNSAYANLENEPILVNNTFSLDDRTLNPAWIYYNSLPPEKKLEYNLVPEMYLTELDN